MRKACALAAIAVATYAADVRGEPAPPEWPPAQEHPVRIPRMAPERHAPRIFSVWLGARATSISYLGPLDGVSVGDYVGTGAGGAIDLGVRLGYVVILFLEAEHDFMPLADSFRHATTGAASDAGSFGVRFGNTPRSLDDVALIMEQHIGARRLGVHYAADFIYETEAFFHYGIGAEVRLTSFSSASMLAWFEGYVPLSTSGPAAIPNLPRSSDNLTGAVGIAAGVHFDLFGR